MFFDTPLQFFNILSTVSRGDFVTHVSYIEYFPIIEGANGKNLFH